MRVVFAPAVMRLLGLVLLLGCTGAAVEDGKIPVDTGRVKRFEEKALSEEEAEAKRVRARYRMGVFQEDPRTLPTQQKIPWMAVGLTLLTFGIVAPFAYRAYRSTLEEMTGAGPDQRRRRR